MFRRSCASRCLRSGTSLSIVLTLQGKSFAFFCVTLPSRQRRSSPKLHSYFRVLTNIRHADVFTSLNANKKSSIICATFILNLSLALVPAQSRDSLISVLALLSCCSCLSARTLQAALEPTSMLAPPFHLVSV